jgi:hypothetical protein
VWVYREHRLDVHHRHPLRLQSLLEEEKTGLEKIQILGLENVDEFYISFVLPLLEWVLSRLGGKN